MRAIASYCASFGSAPEPDWSKPIRCTECGHEGLADAGNIIDFGPIYGCPECDAMEAYLEPLEQRSASPVAGWGGR